MPWIPLTLTCNALGDVLWQASSGSTGSAPDVSVGRHRLAGQLRRPGAAPPCPAGSAGSGGAARRAYAALDGVAVLSVALLVVLQTSVAATLADHGLPVLTRITFIAYPVLDAVLIGLLAWRLVLHGRVRPVVALLLLGFCCWLAADLGWMLLASADTVAGWLDAGWLVGVVLIAAVPWVPQSRADDPAAARGPGHGPWRMVLNVAPFTAPALIEVVAWDNGVDANPLPGLVVWGVLLVVSTIRTRLVALDGQRGVGAGPLPGPAVGGAGGQLLRRRRRRGRRGPADRRLRRAGPGVRPAGRGGHRAGRARRRAWAVTRSRPGMLLRRSVAQPGVPVELELAGRRPDGHPFWLGGRAVNLLDDADVAGIVVSLYDVTARKLAEQELARQAYHDGLTGLANRTLFLDRTEQALRRAGRTGSSPIVLCLDLDGFKDVNDSVGHLAGDELLRVIAGRLQGVVRRGGHRGPARRRRVRRPARRHQRWPAGGRRPRPAAAAGDLRPGRPRRPPGDRGGEHRHRRGRARARPRCRCSGTPTSPCTGRRPPAGRSGWSSTPACAGAALERIELERELSGALAAGQLRLVYQPVVDLRDRTGHRLRGPAALAAPHPRRGRAGQVRPGGRGVRRDRADRPLGAGRGHPHRRPVAARPPGPTADDGGQRLRPAAGRRHAAAARGRGAARQRPGARPRWSSRSPRPRWSPTRPRSPSGWPSCARSASGSRSTTSAPATRR